MGEYEWLTAANYGNGHPTLFIVTKVWYTKYQWGVYSPRFHTNGNHSTPTRESPMYKNDYWSVWGSSNVYTDNMMACANAFAEKHGIELIERVKNNGH